VPTPREATHATVWELDAARTQLALGLTNTASFNSITIKTRLYCIFCRERIFFFSLANCEDKDGINGRVDLGKETLLQCWERLHLLQVLDVNRLDIALHGWV
jgi:hypothetical protein